MSHCSGGHCGHLTKFIPDRGRGGGDGPGMSQLYGGMESGMTASPELWGIRCGPSVQTDTLMFS